MIITDVIWHRLYNILSAQAYYNWNNWWFSLRIVGPSSSNTSSDAFSGLFITEKNNCVKLHKRIQSSTLK